MPLSLSSFFFLVCRKVEVLFLPARSRTHTKLELYRVCNILSRKQKWLVACFLYLLKELKETSQESRERGAEISYSECPHKRRTIVSSIVKKNVQIQVVLWERRWKKFLSIVSVWGSMHKKMWICKLDWNENAKIFIALVCFEQVSSFTILQFYN